jgi:MFS family permease
MVAMPLLPTLGRTVGSGVKAVRLVVRGSVRGGAWATRRVGTVRARGAANEIGMIRLFDLHAVSCAGDALIAIGLAGTIFSVPLGEARSKVGLYLLITMIPFALLAPVVGPLLDHFRHGRRYALAVTMLGRAFLAYVMSDNLLGWGLYPAAFGVLALSRAYGVARSAAVPRLLPDGVGLSQVGARASVYGTFAGAVVAPIGLLAFRFGPQWPLRVASIIFLVGMVVSLRLPPRADSDPPEAMPRAWRTVLGLNRGSDRPLSGRLVPATLIGSSSLRLLYGFLLLFMTFAIMAGDVDTTILAWELGKGTAVGVVGGALALGTFLSTAAGTGLRIRRPLALQSSGLVVTAGVAVLATIFCNLATIALLALVTAVFSGIAKLAVDASIQERVPERLRATAFAHSETVLMLAWVAGGGIGLIPLAGRLGVALVALLAVAAAVRASWSAARLRTERLAGRPDNAIADVDDPGAADSTRPDSARPGPALVDPVRADPVRADPARAGSARPGASSRPDDEDLFYEAADPWPDAPTVPDRSSPNAPSQRRPAGSPAQGTRDRGRTTEPTLIDEPTGRNWWGRRKSKQSSREKRDGKPDAGATSPGEPTKQFEAASPEMPAPPGYHVYRPSSADSARNGDPGKGGDT